MRRIGSETGIGKDCGDGERLRLCLERGHRRDKDAENESTQTGTGGHEGKLRQGEMVLAGGWISVQEGRADSSGETME
jgi:hypothetical protein